MERTFTDDEIIVSKTDPRGLLTYVNDVFLRVSAYREEELIGKPHNVIRHPAMPRCVFRLLWDRIRGGEELFAYVVNLAADGAHYWVLAHVTPTFGPGGSITGFHSNRRTVSRSALEAIEPLYAALLHEEQRHGDPGEAMKASGRLLESTLQEQGQTYEEFIWSLENSPALEVLR